MSMAAGNGAPQYDWSVRVRTTAIEALRYSKFVHLMKRVLSLGAFLIIATLLSFLFVQRQPRQLAVSYEKLGRIENDLAMVKPRLTGADGRVGITIRPTAKLPLTPGTLSVFLQATRTGDDKLLKVTGSRIAQIRIG